MRDECVAVDLKQGRLYARLVILHELLVHIFVETTFLELSALCKRIETPPLAFAAEVGSNVLIAYLAYLLGPIVEGPSQRSDVLDAPVKQIVLLGPNMELFLLAWWLQRKVQRHVVISVAAGIKGQVLVVLRQTMLVLLGRCRRELDLLAKRHLGASLLTI